MDLPLVIRLLNFIKSVLQKESESSMSDVLPSDFLPSYFLLSIHYFAIAVSGFAYQ